MKLPIVVVLCLVYAHLTTGRAVKSGTDLSKALREFLRYYRTRDAQDNENIARAVDGQKKEVIDTSKLDPESSAEDDAESQRVELPEGEKKPKNIQPNKKKEQKEDNLDRQTPTSATAEDTASYKKRHSKRIFEESASYWTDGTIPYTIDASTYAGSESELALLRELLANSIKQLEESSCVRWIERTTETDYVKFINDQGCYSYVGKIGGGQPVSIQADGCTTVHTVLHEMLHAMGGQHEQSRSDRAGKTSIIWNQIESGQINNFAAADTMNAQPYDYKSLMQYELSSFGKSGSNSMSIPDSSFEYLITNTKKELSLYDIGEINTAYKCTADCTNKCNNGGVIIKGSGTCGCKCPSGLKGDDCSQLDTSDGCGGFITLSSGETKTISMDSYTGGHLCTWVVKGPSGTRVKATIESMDLPYNAQYDCYHWLEFRDYLIGDNGKERCGTEGGASFTKVINGAPSRMMIRFNSAKYKDQTPGKGFSVKVETVASGCSNSPCKNGAVCTDTANGGFQCTCSNGLSGDDCNTVAASATTTCDFQNDFKDCVFQFDKTNSKFGFTMASTANQYFPSTGNENGYQFLVMTNYLSYMQYRKSYLLTSATFEESERCLSFKYLYKNNFYDDGEDSQFVFQYEGADGVKKTLCTVGTTDVTTNSWQTVSSTIPATNGLKLTIEAREGYQTVALDDITIKPGACGEETLIFNHGIDKKICGV